MKNKRPSLLCFLVGAIFIAPISLSAEEVVTVDNFVRAETDMTMNRYVDQGAFGKFFHIRTPTPLDKQDVIRMNRDTLYSIGVFDLTEPVTIVKPDSDGRFMSLLIINQDHSMLPVVHDAGEITLTEEEIGTRFVICVFRTFADPADPADVKIANALQDKIQVKQKSPGSFEIPEWDDKSLHTVRDAINVLAGTRSDTKPYFGDKEKLNPLYHLLGTASGWGGNPPEGAMYAIKFPEKNDGKTPHSVTVKDVPVNGFWSMTVYNKDGFMEENDQGAYSYNNVTAKRNDDGSITVNFGAGGDAVNNLPITEGWNYTVRMYQPKQEIIDGDWVFPAVEPKK